MRKPALFNVNTVHDSWKPIIKTAIQCLSVDYKEELRKNPNWLPGPAHIFNAFSLPLDDVQYVLFGESPYPRPQSAIGYAFWDGAVEGLWSEYGLTTTVNRATSLRNLIKMLLVASHRLTATDTSQAAIARLDKHGLVQTNQQLFNNIQQRGILLLNASLILSDRPVTQEAKAWLPFMEAVLGELHSAKPDTQLILLGNIAKKLARIPSIPHYRAFHAPHPYNLSFIHDPKVLAFFAPLQLLEYLQ